MIRTKKSFELRTSVFYAEPEEREPRRGELWAMFGCWAVAMFFAVFFAYGLYKAFEVFLEKVGLGG